MFYNRRDLALTFARDRRCGTVRRLLDFAAGKDEGTRGDVVFWAPAPLRAAISAITALLQRRGLAVDAVLHALSFLSPSRDLDSLGWRLPLPLPLSLPLVPQALQLAADAAAGAASAPAPPSATAAPPPRLFRCSLYAPNDGPRNQLIVRVLTPHRHLSSEELNMYLGRYGFVSSEPLSPDGLVMSDAEAAAAAAAAGYRSGAIRVLLFLVRVDSAHIAGRAVESCLVAQIDFLAWAVQVPYNVQAALALASVAASVPSGDAGQASARAATAAAAIATDAGLAGAAGVVAAANASVAAHFTADELALWQRLDRDPCVIPLPCLPPPDKLWLRPLVDVAGAVRRRRQRGADAAGGPGPGAGVAAGAAGAGAAGGAHHLLAGGGSASGLGAGGMGPSGALSGLADEDWGAGAADERLGDIRLLPEIAVDGIPYWVTDEMLLSRCSEFGAVKRVRFATCDRTGAHLGCAAVTMSSVAEAVKLHDGLDGRVIEGCAVRCGIVEAIVAGEARNGGSDDGAERGGTAAAGRGDDLANEVRYELVSLRTGAPLYAYD
jgi:hypothetical protein